MLDSVPRSRLDRARARKDRLKGDDSVFWLFNVSMLYALFHRWQRQANPILEVRRTPEVMAAVITFGGKWGGRWVFARSSTVDESHQYDRERTVIMVVVEIVQRSLYEGGISRDWRVIPAKRGSEYE